MPGHEEAGGYHPQEYSAGFGQAAGISHHLRQAAAVGINVLNQVNDVVDANHQHAEEERRVGFAYSGSQIREA